MAASAVLLLLDTAFCLTVIRTRQVAALQSLLADYAPGHVGISSMTLAALQARVQRSSDPPANRDALEQFILPLVVVDFDADAAQTLGRIAGWWTQHEDPTVTHVQFLAAQSIALGARLVTSRPDLYAAVPGLQLQTSLAEPPPGSKPATQSLDSPHLRRTSGAVIAAGSHDMTLDLLADSLHARHPDCTLVSAHVGSLQGLLALQRREAHLAGAHLLDGETGEYNVPQIRQLLTSHHVPVVLLGFVRRIQGLIVAAGNPLGLTDYGDLLREDVRFVNRQSGSGTRVLLDYELRRRDLSARKIRGYGQIESSHLSVAMAVAGGSAECGLGIQAAARAHNLDFIPLSEERYDLVIPVEHYNSPRLAPLLEMLRQPPADFLRRVHALGGYRTEGMGVVLGEF